jgi:dTDP-L-rhamnose 4-epimerase
VTEQFRAGDIRHCYADISRIQQLLGYQPTVTFEQGVAELVAWVGNQQGVKNDGEKATNQLQQLGLVR